MTDEQIAAAIAAIETADRAIDHANEEARRIQREAGDVRAFAVAKLVDVAGRDGAAEALGVSKSAIDKATQRVKALRD